MNSGDIVTVGVFRVVLPPDMTFLPYHLDRQLTVIRWQVILIKARRCLWQRAIHVGGKQTHERNIP